MAGVGCRKRWTDAVADFWRTRALFQRIRIPVYGDLENLCGCQTPLAMISDDLGTATEGSTADLAAILPRFCMPDKEI